MGKPRRRSPAVIGGHVMFCPPYMTKYARLFGSVGLILLGWFGHSLTMTPRSVIPAATMCDLADSTMLRDVRLPSVIPNLYVAAKLQFVSKVDLRRADLALNIKHDMPIKPLMDKVLVIPKRFS